MVLFRLGPVLIYHYNFLLVFGLVGGLFVVYQAAKRRDYNLAKVIDWALWGVLVSLLGLVFLKKVGLFSLDFSFVRLVVQRAYELHPSLGGFVGWFLAEIGRIELGIVIFLLYTRLLFQNWRWELFPPLDFLALGVSLFYLVAQTSLGTRTPLVFLIHSYFWVPAWLINGVYYGALFYFLLWRFRKDYREGVVFWNLLLFSLRPLELFFGTVGVLVVEWERLGKIAEEVGEQGRVLLDKFENLYRNMSKSKKDQITEEATSDRNEDKKREQQLREEEQELEERIKDLEEVSPENDPGRLHDNAPEEDAEEAEAGVRFAALKNVFLRRLKEVRVALNKLRGGSYGICDRCGEEIDPARMKAKPDARYCLDCAKSVEEKS